MLLKAAEDYNIDLNASWMIGDGENDVLCGKNAGTHTALIQSNKEADDSTDELKYYGADLVGNNLFELVNRIL